MHHKRSPHSPRRAQPIDPGGRKRSAAPPRQAPPAARGLLLRSGRDCKRRAESLLACGISHGVRTRTTSDHPDRAGGNPGEGAQPYDGIFATFDLGTFEPGNYTLETTAEDNAGRRAPRNGQRSPCNDWPIRPGLSGINSGSCRLVNGPRRGANSGCLQQSSRVLASRISNFGIHSGNVLTRCPNRDI